MSELGPEGCEGCARTCWSGEGPDGSVRVVHCVPDDPGMDMTPGEHRAYSRGERNGVRGAVARIEDALDGRDDGNGVMGDERLEAVRRKVLGLRKRLGL